MSGLEASIAGTDTHMLGELSYALPASAQYMKKREEIYWTSGANVYAPNGIRTLRINVSGQGFLDCSSLVLEAEVHNLAATGGASDEAAGWRHGGVLPELQGHDFGNDRRGARRPIVLLRASVPNALARFAQREDSDGCSVGFRARCKWRTGADSRRLLQEDPA